jgi:PadR family transcriptional regulator PadR
VTTNREGGRQARSSSAESPTLFATGFLRLCILMFLSERPSHGYELAQRLATAGMATPDRSGLYRALRALESESLVSSHWQTRRSGPPRRIYELTPTGRDMLSDSLLRLVSLQGVLADFLNRHVPGPASANPPPGAPRSGAKPAVDSMSTTTERRPNPRGV